MMELLRRVIEFHELELKNRILGMKMALKSEAKENEAQLLQIRCY